MRVRALRHVLAATAVAATAVAGVLTATPTGAAAVGPAAAHRALPTGGDRTFTSTAGGWVGYVVSGYGPYTSVSASWTQPAVSCAGATEDTYSSFWVGLDGSLSDRNTIEQTGTEADCINGSPFYGAWYESYPNPPIFLSGPVVMPGDLFYAKVTANGSGSFTTFLEDKTQGDWTYSVTFKLGKAQRASAEVVVETPMVNGETKPLSDFGTVNFSGATANGTSFASLTGLQAYQLPGVATICPMSASGDFSIHIGTGAC
ncbi:MAG TPA: G1 family glutamic endopeptidase [Jatrophihabitans sp.]|nr:G1 family glutamic endopeptidase [Jatrophihabitans sp.]